MFTALRQLLGRSSGPSGGALLSGSIRTMATRLRQSVQSKLKPRDPEKVANLMKRGARGLYGGKLIQFGNRVSFSEIKNRRTWKPNIQNKRFWSETYNRFLQFRVVASVIKQVKALPHGIDDYIMRTPRPLLRYRKAIQMQKNLLKIHNQREVNLHPTETNARGVPAYIPLEVYAARGPVGGPGGSQDKREKAEKAAARAAEEVESREEGTLGVVGNL